MESNLMHLQALVGLLGEGRCLTGDAIGADYCRDEYPGEATAPEAVCLADSTEAVSAVLKTCHEAGITVTVRGAGTGKAGGCVPVKGGVVLSLRDMDKFLGFDSRARTLTAQCGVLLQDIKAEAAKNGLCYPPDPGEKTSTIGGNASTNASGPCTVKYGRTADYVADATIVLADGTVAKLSDRPEYAAAIGSEGTLAVITELTLRLVEKPAADVILLLPFMDAADCIGAASKLREAGFDAATYEYLDTCLVEFSGKVTGNPVFPVETDGERVACSLMVTLEGADDDELDEKMEAVAEMMEELGCLDILVVDTPTLKRDVRAAYDAFHTSLETAPNSGEVNVEIPAEYMAELVAFAKELGEGKGLSVMACGHAGSGGLHLYAVSALPAQEFAAANAEYEAGVYARVRELGGNPIGEYGVGYAKRGLFRSESGFRKLAEAKAALDPKGILNPGKVV